MCNMDISVFSDFLCEISFGDPGPWWNLHTRVYNQPICPKTWTYQVPQGPGAPNEISLYALQEDVKRCQ